MGAGCGAPSSFHFALCTPHFALTAKVLAIANESDSPNEQARWGLHSIVRFGFSTWHFPLNSATRICHQDAHRRTTPTSKAAVISAVISAIIARVIGSVVDVLRGVLDHGLVGVVLRLAHVDFGAASVVEQRIDRCAQPK